MGLKAAPAHTKKADLPQLSAGLHHAIIYGVFHIGHQDPFKKDDEPKDRFYISFELPYERMEYEDDTGVKRNLPRAVSTEYTRSMHKKAAFRIDLEAWEGRTYTDMECDNFELTSLIGRNCQVNLAHKNGSGQNIGRVYTNVIGILPIGRSTPERKQENPPVFFSFTDIKEGDEIIFPKGMPDFMRRKAMSSPEYAHLLKCFTEAQARRNQPVVPQSIPLSTQPTIGGPVSQPGQVPTQASRPDEPY